MDGKGLFTWKSGKTYEGDWVDNRMNGKGIMKWPDGRVYNGEFVNDLRSGKGYIITLNGKKLWGIFKEGKMIEREDKSNLQLPV